MSDDLELVGLALFLLVPSVVCCAKPESPWAERFYDDEKLRRAVPTEALYGDIDPPEDLADFSPEEIALQDKVTRKAWEKANRRKA